MAKKCDKFDRDAVRDDIASPIVVLDSLFITSMIYTKEIRDVAITNIPSAYLQVDMDKDACMMLERLITEPMVKVATEMYSSYMIYGGGESIIYVKLKNAVYWYLQSTLLFYRRLPLDVVKKGFVINCYNPYVPNTK